MEVRDNKCKDLPQESLKFLGFSFVHDQNLFRTVTNVGAILSCEEWEKIIRKRWKIFQSFSSMENNPFSTCYTWTKWNNKKNWEDIKNTDIESKIESRQCMVKPFMKYWKIIAFFSNKSWEGTRSLGLLLHL